MKRAACFDVPLYHEMQWDEQSKGNERTAGVAATGDERVAGFSDGYMKELFHRFVAENPAEIPTNKRDSAAKVRAKLHALADQVPEFETLRKQTIRDPMWAGMATTSFAEQVCEALPELDDKPHDADRGRNRLESLLDMGISDPELEGEAYGDLFGAAEQAVDIDEGKIRQAIRRGVESAQEAIDSAQAAMDAFGVGGNGGCGTMPDPATARELARRVRNSDKLAKIVALAGRLQATAHAKRASRTQYARSEIVGVEQTSDIARLLPVELGMLNDPVRSVDLFRRLSEKAAVGYRMAGREKEGKGPIVICLDVSGSMAQGGKDEWSKAVALAVLDIARHEKRAFGIALFNHGLCETYLAENPSKASPLELLDVIMRGPGGDTDYSPAIGWATTQIASSKFRKADVILVTDGIADGTRAPAMRKKLVELGATVYGVAIGCEGRALAAWCDKVARVDDVSRDTEATDLIFDGL